MQNYESQDISQPPDLSNFELGQLSDNPLKVFKDARLKRDLIVHFSKQEQIPLTQTLHFVKTLERKTQKVSQSMATAFELARVSAMSAQWVTPETAFLMADSAEKRPPSSPQVFIMDSFKDSLFHTLCSSPVCRVFGPSAVFHCQPRRNLLLPLRQNPVFNLTMRNVHVSCSQLSLEEKKFVQGSVSLMGGHVSEDLLPTVTHLVSSNHVSMKAMLARKCEVPIMSYEWVKACWEKSLCQEIRAEDSEMMQYRLPIFKGFHICVSQVNLFFNLKIFF